MNSTGTERAAAATAAAGAEVSVRIAIERNADIPLAKRSRAARLIEQLIGTGMPADELATAIVVNDRTLEAYRSGRTKIPLQRQLCLALIGMEQPAVRRAAFALRAQVEAEMAVESTRTQTHNGPPVTNRWP